MVTSPPQPSWLWVFDVDATLLDGMSALSVRPRADELLSLLAAREVRLIAWSAGGADYAERKLTTAGIGHYFAEFRDKGNRTGGFYDTSFADSWGVFVDDQARDLSPVAVVHPVRPYLAPNPNDTGLDGLFALVPPTRPVSRTRPIHPMHGTHDPRAGEPGLLPATVRRVTRIDSIRPEGVLGPVHMYAYGSDVHCTESGEEVILSSVTISASIGFSDGRRLLSLAIDPPVLGSEALIGVSVAFGFRTAVDQIWPSGATSHSTAYQLLDDFPTAALVSGYAIGAAGVKMRANRPRPQYPDLCAGFAADAFILRDEAATGVIPTPTGPDAPKFSHTWPGIAPLPPHGMRRLRCIDVTAAEPDTGRYTVVDYFRDSHADVTAHETVVHEYTVETSYTPDTGTFGDTEAIPHSLPWVECPLAATSAHRLGGTSASGLRQHIRNSYVGRTTCTHLNDTLRALEDVPHLVRLLTR
jgi:Protein of unknown function (DUF2889)